MAVVFTVALFLLPNAASAQEATQPKAGLAISPAIFEAVLEPGVAQAQVVKIGNITDFPLPIKVHARSFAPLDDARLADGVDTSVFDASEWFSFDESEFILQPREQREVAVTVAPPTNAEPGGHYATVLFTPLIPDGALGANSTFLASEVGALAFMIVRGDIAESAKILPPSDPPTLLHFGPIETAFEVENSGSVHIMPSGAFRIKDMFGREVAYEQIRPRIVLPGTIQPFKLRWGSAWMLNRYDITPEFNFGTPTQQLSADPITVWVVPWVPITIGFVLLFFLLWFWWRTHSRWAKAWRIIRGKSFSSR